MRIRIDRFEVTVENLRPGLEDLKKNLLIFILTIHITYPYLMMVSHQNIHIKDSNTIIKYI